MTGEGFARMAVWLSRAAVVVVVLVLLVIANAIVGLASADSHSGGWQRAEIRECEMRVASGFAASGDWNGVATIARRAKQVCAHLRGAE